MIPLKKIVIAGVVVVLGLATVGVYWKFFRFPKLEFVDLRPREGEVVEGDRVEVSGRTTVEATVQIAVYRGNKVVNRRYVKTSPEGAFSQPMELFDPVTETAAKEGTYRLSLVASDSKGNEIPKEISLQVAKERERWAKRERQGDRAYSRGRYADAIKIWEDIPENYRPSDKVKEAKRKLEQDKQIAQKVREGDELFSQGRYAEAKALWEETPTAYRPSEKIRRAETKIQNQTLKETGDKYFNSGEYENAIETYGQISLEDRPLDKIVEAKKLLGRQREEALAKEREEKPAEEAPKVERLPEEEEPGQPEAERWAQESEKARGLLAEGRLQEAKGVVEAIPSQYQDRALMQQIAEAEKWARKNEKARSLLAEGKLREAKGVVEAIPPQYQDHELMQRIKEQLVEAEKWAQRNEEAWALFAEGELEEPIEVLREIPMPYRDQKLVDQIDQTLGILRKGFDAFGQENYKEALEQWGQLSEAHRSKAETEMETAQWIIEGGKSYEQGERNAKETRYKKALQNLRGAIAAWEKVPEKYQNFVVDRIRKAERKIEEIEQDPFQLGMSAVEDGSFQEAVQQFDRVEPSKRKNYLAARWNIAILSLSEGPTQDVDRAIRELDSISQIRARWYQTDNVFVRFYKGIAHYRKGRTYKDMLDMDKAIKAFEEAVGFFEKARSKIPEFSMMKIDDTLIPGPERNVTDLYYYTGMSYFFLYQYAVFNVEDLGLIKRYKLNVQDNLTKCFKKSPTPEQKKEIPTILKQLK